MRCQFCLTLCSVKNTIHENVEAAVNKDECCKVRLADSLAGETRASNPTRPETARSAAFYASTMAPAGGGALTGDGKAFVEACAGAIGSVAATWIIFPLDTARARFQVGARAVFSARRRNPCGSRMFGIWSSQSCGAHAGFHAPKGRRWGGENCPGDERNAGPARRGETWSPLFQSLRCVRTLPRVASPCRGALQRVDPTRDGSYSPRPRAFRSLQARNEGISGLYAGMGVRSAHALSQAFVYFFAYNLMRRRYEARRPSPQLPLASSPPLSFHRVQHHPHPPSSVPAKPPCPHPSAPLPCSRPPPDRHQAQAGRGHGPPPRPHGRLVQHRPHRAAGHPGHLSPGPSADSLSAVIRTDSTPPACALHRRFSSGRPGSSESL